MESTRAVPTAQSVTAKVFLHAVVGAMPAALALYLMFGTILGFQGATIAAAWGSLAALWNLSGLSINGLIITGDVVRFTGSAPRNPFSAEHYQSVVAATSADNPSRGLVIAAINGLRTGVAITAAVTVAYLLLG